MAISTIKDLIAATTAGLKAGKDLKPTREGLKGSYYISDASENCVAVLKPLNEEPNAEKNPKKQQSEEGNKEVPGGSFVEGTPEGLKKGTKAGKGGYREAVAYILDHPISGRRSDSPHPTTFGFAGVPPTTFGSCYHRKGGDAGQGPITERVGSLQMYMENAGDCALAKIESNIYNKFPRDEVHKIAVLDIRLANADRHGGNILRSKSDPVKLIPIDHGYCLPESFGGGKFDWLAWPQAKKQFSDETIKYIETLDAQKDIDLLKSYGWVMPLAVARVFHTSTMLLKKGADKGLTPHAIGVKMCRSENEPECEIEKIFNKASKQFPLKKNDKEDNFKSDFIKAVSAEIDTLFPT